MGILHGQDKHDLLLERLSCKREFDGEACFATLLSYAEKYGIKVVCTTDRDEYPFGWDGKTLRIESESAYRRSYDMAHELAHWILAPTERRVLKEFGLGQGFSTHEIRAAEEAMAVTDDEALEEEVLACILSGLILYDLGADTFNESSNTNLIMEKEEFLGIGMKYTFVGDSIFGSCKNPAIWINRVEWLISQGLITHDLHMRWDQVK